MEPYVEQIFSLNETIMGNDIIDVSHVNNTIIDINSSNSQPIQPTSITKTTNKTQAPSQTVTATSSSNKRARSNTTKGGTSSSLISLAKSTVIPTDEREKDELITHLRSEVQRLERIAQNHFPPYANPSWTNTFGTSLWDIQTGLLVECNRNFYNEYHPRFSAERKSITLTGTEGDIVCTGAIMPLLRSIVHTSFMFKPKAHGRGFIMLGTCRIIRGPNCHLVSMITWEV